MSDFSDSEPEVDELDIKFTQATEHIQNTHSAYDQKVLLELYGLYKQATTGPCNTIKPGIFNLQARSKWTAWHDLGDMPQDVAKQLYFERVQQLNPDWYTSVEKGQQKQKSLGNSWVVHSIPTASVDDISTKPEHEKNSFDFIKEENLAKLKENLTPEQLEELDENGMGLIHWATDRNATEILQYLLSNGANVNLRDAENQTALHYAASCGHADCVRILLNSNADAQLKDNDGQSCKDVSDDPAIRELFGFD